MIDVHTHILPSIDDGSKDIEETFKILREAAWQAFLMYLPRLII